MCGYRDIYTLKDMANMANEFNKFFTNVGSNVAKNITNRDKNTSIYGNLGGRTRNGLYIKPVDKQ